MLAVAFAGTRIDAVVSPVLSVLAVLLLWSVFALDAASEDNRMFPRKAMNPATRVGAGLLFVLVNSFSTMSLLVYGSILLETIHDVSPLTAGFIVALESLAWGVAAVAVSRCSEALEATLIRTGAALIVAGILGFAATMSTGPLWLLLIAAFVPTSLAAGLAAWRFTATEQPQIQRSVHS